jgi:hypothetical protein
VRPGWVASRESTVGIMGIATSMFLIAVGAIMRFAVTAQGRGFNVHTTGVVLMVVGILGALLSIGFWASWGGFGHAGGRGTARGGQATVVSGERTIVREREVL